MAPILRMANGLGVDGASYGARDDGSDESQVQKFGQTSLTRNVLVDDQAP